MQCRPACGACCIAPSIEQSFWGMPAGKAAGTRCVHLDEQQRCRIFDDPRRPQICASFMPEEAFCGSSTEQALSILMALEIQTRTSQNPTIIISSTSI
ncbi:MAG: YkgJ family cysteine cluster protein [Parahaliea sp.]